jgi:photosystem II stability/assembly factor-like uncharacterized protein
MTKLGAPSSNVVWASVGGAHYRSTNRGDTWESLSGAPVYPGLKEISFIDAQQGYLVGPIQEQCTGADTEVWHTYDANGWYWVGMWRMSHNSDNVGSLECREGLSFIDPTHVFIGAWADGRHPTVYRTVDGGKTWSGVDLPDPPDFQTGPGFSLRAGLVKKFGSALYVIAWGKQPGGIPDRQYMFRSTDDGATWSWLMKVPSRYIAMVTESRWLMLLAPGQSMESTNGGQQWHLYGSDFITDTEVGGPQIVFADSQVGYAEGRGALQRTIDGGLHWVRIATPRGYLPAPTPPTVASSARTNPADCRNEPAGGWLTYSSTQWAYSVDYPADWCNLGDFGVPEAPKYFASENVSAPLLMSAAGIWLSLSAVPGACQPLRGIKQVYDQMVLKVAGQEVTRTYGLFSPGQSESLVMIHAAIAHAGSCYKFEFLTLNKPAGDKYLATADKMITSLKFS